MLAANKEDGGAAMTGWPDKPVIYEINAAIWLGEIRRSRAGREQDAHIELLLELAATALARCRREAPAQADATPQNR